MSARRRSDDGAQLDAAIEALGDATSFSLPALRRLSPEVVRRLLAVDSRAAKHVFARLAIPDLDELSDARLAARWLDVLAALQSLSLTYAWGSKLRRDRLRGLARDRDMLLAIQGAAAMGEEVPLDMLAVLAADGSDASIDALIPHLGSALDERDARLERLLELRTHAAKTPRMRALLAELGETYDARNAKSPALALGPLIGVGQLPVLWFDAVVWSRGGDIAHVQINISVDSRKASWFRVHVSTRDSDAWSSFGSDGGREDHHHLGSCEASDLPGWLARTAKRLRVTWRDHHISSNLRGAKRARIAAWLDGKPAT